MFEVRNSLRRIVTVLQRLKREGTSVLLASVTTRTVPPERRALQGALQTSMDKVYTVEENPHGTHSTDIHDGHPAGNGQLVKVPARAAQEDQEALDDLFRAARLQLAGSAYAARPIPFESIAMSMLLAQHRTIRRLEQLTQHSRSGFRHWRGDRMKERQPSAPATEGGDAPNHRLAV